MTLPVELKRKLNRSYLVEFTISILMLSMLLFTSRYIGEDYRYFEYWGILLCTILLVGKTIYYLVFINSKDFKIYEGIITEKMILNNKDYGYISLDDSNSKLPCDREQYHQCKIGDNVWFVMLYGKTRLIMKK